MSIQGLNNVDASIKQLNTPTFVSSYTEKHIDNQPKTFVGWVKATWAWLWLKGLGSTGWKAGEGVVGVGSIAQEHKCVANYQSKLTDLISHLARTPITDLGRAHLLNMAPESGTSANDPDNKRIEASEDLEGKIDAFYAALKERVEQLAGTDGADASTVDNQAALYKAGLQEVADKIRAHNQARKEAYVFKQPYIAKNWDVVVNSQISQKARTNLAQQITPDDIINNGPKALADAVDLFVKTFGSTEPKNSIVASVRKEIIETRGSEFEEALKDIESEDYYNICVDEKRSPLLLASEKAQEKLRLLEKRAKELTETMSSEYPRIEDPQLELDQIKNQIDHLMDADFAAVAPFVAPFIKEKCEDMSDFDFYTGFARAEASLMEKDPYNDALPKLNKITSIQKRYMELEEIIAHSEGVKTKIGIDAKFLKETLDKIKQTKEELVQINDQLHDVEANVSQEIQDTTQHLNFFINARSISDKDLFSLMYRDQRESQRAAIEAQIEQDLRDNYDPKDFVRGPDDFADLDSYPVIPKPAHLETTAVQKPAAIQSIMSIFSNSNESDSAASFQTDVRTIDSFKEDPFADLENGSHMDPIATFDPTVNTFNTAPKYAKPQAPHKAVKLDEPKLVILPGNTDESPLVTTMKSKGLPEVMQIWTNVQDQDKAAPLKSPLVATS